MPNILNVSAYKFVELVDCPALRERLLADAQACGLKGTILLATEGINLFLAGEPEGLRGFLDRLQADPRLGGLPIKESWSAHQPFRRMLVKVKREIIRMNHPTIRPAEGRAPAVDARTLRRWLDQGHDDEGKPVVMVDTRNDFEVDVGTFDHTIDYRIAKFSDFPDVIAKHKDELNDKTVVTFCTGGIRCEKAGIYMQNVGYEHVYQLEGGILKYFEEVGGDHYDGDCFVFDHRTALNPQLEETATAQCFACRAVVTPREQLSPLYVEGKSCPHCADAAAAA